MPPAEAPSTAQGKAASPAPSHGGGIAPAGRPAGADSSADTTIELRLADILAAEAARAVEAATAVEAGRTASGVEATMTPGATRRAVAATAPPRLPDLLDGVDGWDPAATSHGEFRLEPVRLPRDLERVSTWMNDPEVAAFWELAGPASVTEAHLLPQLTGDGRSVPCLGLLDGVPMSYWEIYRADLDVLTPHYPARAHDTGVHLLLGGAGDRGRGLGSVLLRAVAELVLAHRPACERVLAEPDVRNLRSVAAFERAGFHRAMELELPGKCALLMVHERPTGPPTWANGACDGLT